MSMSISNIAHDYSMAICRIGSR